LGVRLPPGSPFRQAVVCHPCQPNPEQGRVQYLHSGYLPPFRFRGAMARAGQAAGPQGL